MASAAAEEVLAILRAAVRARGQAAVALAGGSTPRRLFEELAARGPRAAPWSKVQLWWGDERAVPPEHADSNYGMARRALIDPLGLDDAQVHRMHGERDDLEGAAASYEAALVAARGAPPVFDLILLGLGSDGHTASLFPESPALAHGADPDDQARTAATSRWVVANPVDSPLTRGATTRLTLTARTINEARHVRFVVTGADKAEALAAILEGPRDPRRYPAQLIAPRGDLAWFVDAAAAARLTEL
ncbi:MAG: 6-phosphogluconolactonase [Kofleriaceae bacterium]